MKLLPVFFFSIIRFFFISDFSQSCYRHEQRDKGGKEEKKKGKEGEKKRKVGINREDKDHAKEGNERNMRYDEKVPWDNDDT